MRRRNWEALVWQPSCEFLISAATEALVRSASALDGRWFLTCRASVGAGFIGC